MPGGCALRWWKCCVLIPWPNRALWIAGWDWRPLDQTEANSTESRLVKPIFTPVFESDDFCPGISETLHLPVVPVFFGFFFAVPIVSYSAGQICNLHRIYIHISVFVCMRIVGCFAAHATIVGLSCKGITVGQTFCCCAACWGLLKDFDLPVLVFIVWDNLCWVGVLFVSFFFAVEFVCLFQWRFLFLFFFKAVLNTALPTWQRTTSRRCLWLF